MELTKKKTPEKRNGEHVYEVSETQKTSIGEYTLSELKHMRASHEETKAELTAEYNERIRFINEKIESLDKLIKEIEGENEGSDKR